MMAKNSLYAGVAPRRILKSLNAYVFQVEDLRNFIQDATAIMSHVLSSETGMPVVRLMNLVKTCSRLKVQVHWNGLPHSENTFEPLANFHKVVQQMLHRLLERKNVSLELAAKARSEIAP